MNVNELIGTYQKEITEITELKNEKYIDDKCLETAVCWIERFVEDLKDLSTIEYSHKEKLPRVLANFVEELKNTNKRYGIFLEETFQNTKDSDLANYLSMNENIEKVFKAISNGYEVEEEPKYYVRFPFSVWNNESAELDEDYVYLHYDITSDETCFSPSDQPFRDYKPTFTEWHIKNINENYWPFAVPIEEENNG